MGFDYSHPERCADIVMKGGVTSGVVYPLAICDLAQTYRLRNIGGTSVGAIAAVVAAAAEYDRYRDPSGGGFKAIEGLPHWLGAQQRGRTNLLWLFHPQRRTRALYDTLVGALEHKRRLLWLGIGAVLRFRLAAFLGALLGLGVLAVAVVGLVSVGGWTAGVLFTIVAVVGLLLLVVGAVTGGVAGLVVRAFREIPRNWFGLCAGAGEDDGPVAPLSTWLADYVDAVGGKTDGSPLTFGDLWWAGEERPNPPADAYRKEGDRAINLAMMTTSLTLGRPYRFPFVPNSFPGGELVVFSSAELREFFPARIVGWMEARGTEKLGGLGLQLPEGYYPLPDAADVPLVVGARMSMSFPILLSAIPLYLWLPGSAFDPERQRCWFSDGGITSNFPVHFFDSPFPRWPTFGINLRGPRRRDGRLYWVLDSYEESPEDSWDDIHGLLGFLFALKDTVQNWLDNSQQRMPGWRDRIANVGFKQGEGGLNLSMPDNVISELSERGRLAAELLRHRFADPPASPDALSWESHRWVRYRSTMSILGRFFGNLCTGWAEGPCARRRRRSPAHPRQGSRPISS